MGLGLAIRSIDRLEIMAIDLDRVPSKCASAGSIGIAVPAQLGLASLAEAIHVQDGSEVVELVVAGMIEGLPLGAFRHLAVTQQYPGSERQLIQIIPG